MVAALTLVLAAQTFATPALGFNLSQRDGSCPEGMSGDGFSEATACEVTSWRQLDAIRQDVTLHYRLMNDLTDASPEYAQFAGSAANSGLGWEPISGPCEDGGMGCTYPGFSGTFNSRGFTIDTLTVNRPGEEVGLFRSIEQGTVRNLGLTRVSIMGATVGAITGLAYTATIERVRVTGLVVGSMHAGGIVGLSSFDTVLRQVASYAQVEGEGDTGGLAGRMDSGLTVEDSYVSGVVIEIGTSGYTGGLIGLVVVDVGWTTTIERVYSTAPVSGKFSTVGAVFGEVRNAGALLNPSCGTPPMR